MLNRIMNYFKNKNTNQNCIVVNTKTNVIDLYSIQSSTCKLLKEKGFSISSDDYLIKSRILLLESEVSELVDSIKKDKSIDEQKLEVADIIIRACNFPIMFNFEATDFIQASKTNKKLLIDLSTARNKNEFKLDTLFGLRNSCIKISELALKFNKIDLENQTKLTKFKNEILKELVTLYEYGNIYVHIIDDKTENLHTLVKRKINDNFERPYRFNCSEFFR